MHNVIVYTTLYCTEKYKETNTIAKQKIVIFYQRRVLLPFVKLAREELYGWKEDNEANQCEIPDPLTAIYCTNGASVQLNDIFVEEQHEVDQQLKIITNKYSTAHTIVDQPCDLSPCFLSFRKLVNGIPCDDIPEIGLQMKIKSKFTGFNSKGILKLKYKKEAALVDFIGLYTSTVTRVCQTESIARGSLSSRIIFIPCITNFPRRGF